VIVDSRRSGGLPRPLKDITLPEFMLANGKPFVDGLRETTSWPNLGHLQSHKARLQFVGKPPLLGRGPQFRLVITAPCWPSDRLRWKFAAIGFGGFRSTFGFFFLVAEKKPSAENHATKK